MLSGFSAKYISYLNVGRVNYLQFKRLAEELMAPVKVSAACHISEESRGQSWQVMEITFHWISAK